MESQPRPPAPASEGRSAGPGRRRAGAVAIGLGVLCLAWGALHMADASLEGSGKTFETRQSYDQVKRRSQRAFLGTLVRAGAGALLIGLGTRLRRS